LLVTVSASAGDRDGGLSSADAGTPADATAASAEPEDREAGAATAGPSDGGSPADASSTRSTATPPPDDEYPWWRKRPEPPKPPEPPAPSARWYGWPIAIADLSAIGLAFLGSLEATTSHPSSIHDVWPVEIGVAIGAYLLGGPITHHVYGHDERVKYSVGLRLLPVLFGLALGAWTMDNTNCSGRYCGNNDQYYDLGFGVGAGVSALLIVPIDGMLLAWERPPASRASPASPASPPKAIQLTPLVSGARDSAQTRIPIFGVSGRF
jgi:hypothetical protein